MRKTDINRYNTTTTEFRTTGETGRVAGLMVRSFFSAIWALLKTVVTVVFIAGCMVLATVIAYILSMRNQAALELQKTEIDLKYTSFVYAQDENGVDRELMEFYNIENRVWVDYKNIPAAMVKAITAIEDKRFFEHEGVDWQGVLNGIRGLITGGGRGGSTITQQLIKNITGENQVSLNRKIKEIFSALALEKKYSKEQILESYLNIVNFGSGCRGVQAAATTYFDKDIEDCSIAECATIAGITQNPSYFNPFIFPEHNKERRELILSEMLDQGKITQEEYDQAMKESAKMKFTYSDDQDDEKTERSGIWDWYTDAMFEKLVAELKETLGCTSEVAEMMIYQGGIKIHSAVDARAQRICEEVYSNPEMRPEDHDILSGIYMIGYNGRVLATVGSFEEKEGNRVWSNAIDAGRQIGSSIKPLAVYSQALERGMINYSSSVSDEPIENYFPDGKPGPNNFGGYTSKKETVAYALEVSLNVPAARLCSQLTPMASYTFLTEKLGFRHLDPEQDPYSLAAMALGGVAGGITMEELGSGFTIFGNGGQYYEPYYYFYVEDHDGKIIIDHREDHGEQVISTETATIMNKLLKNVMYGYSGTGYGYSVDGWECFGKTGTTDDNRDATMVGGTPACVAAIWTGYDIPEELPSTRYPRILWKEIMTQYLEDKNPDDYSFVLDDDIISATYCKDTGLLAGTTCKKTATGWYEKGHLPQTCKENHNSSSSKLKSSASSRISSSVSSRTSSRTSSVISSEPSRESSRESSLPPSSVPPPPSSSSSKPSKPSSSESSEVSSEPSKPSSSESSEFSSEPSKPSSSESSEISSEPSKPSSSESSEISSEPSKPSSSESTEVSSEPSKPSSSESTEVSSEEPPEPPSESSSEEPPETASPSEPDEGPETTTIEEEAES